MLHERDGMVFHTITSSQTLKNHQPDPERHQRTQQDNICYVCTVVDYAERKCYNVLFYGETEYT